MGLRRIDRDVARLGRPRRLRSDVHPPGSASTRDRSAGAGAGAAGARTTGSRPAGRATRPAGGGGAAGTDATAGTTPRTSAGVATRADDAAGAEDAARSGRPARAGVAARASVAARSAVAAAAGVPPLGGRASSALRSNRTIGACQTTNQHGGKQRTAQNIVVHGAPHFRRGTGLRHSTSRPWGTVRGGGMDSWVIAGWPLNLSPKIEETAEGLQQTTGRVLQCTNCADETIHVGKLRTSRNDRRNGMTLPESEGQPSG